MRPAALLLIAALGCNNEAPRDKDLERATAKAAEAQAAAESAKADVERLQVMAERADRAALAADSEVRDLDRTIEEVRQLLDELAAPRREARLRAREHIRHGDAEADARLHAAKRHADELDARHEELMGRLKVVSDAREEAARRVRGCATNPTAWRC